MLADVHACTPGLPSTRYQFGVSPILVPACFVFALTKARSVVPQAAYVDSFLNRSREPTRILSLVGEDIAMPDSDAGSTAYRRSFL